MSAYGTYETYGLGEIASAFKVKPDAGSRLVEVMGVTGDSPLWPRSGRPLQQRIVPPRGEGALRVVGGSPDASRLSRVRADEYHAEI